MQRGSKNSSTDDGNGKFAQRLWRWGLPSTAIVAFAVAVAHILSMFQIIGADIVADKSDGALKYLGLAIVALGLLRAGGLLKAKFAGVELEFADTIADHANKQEATIQQLKADVFYLKGKFGKEEDGKFKSIAATDKTHADEAAKVETMPKLSAVMVAGDSNKKRFGEHSDKDGFKLEAYFRFKKYDDPLVTVILSVSRDDGCAFDRPVRFFLHETFGDRQEITVTPSDGKISLELLVYGGFTVGAWVEGTKTLLELDLAQQRNAPEVIKRL